jgi:hypothetical protein
VQTRQRRGRPPGLLSDQTPLEADHFDSEIRVGWLLRSWRLHLRPESNARSFAADLTRLGVSADSSRVSRWETGRVPAPLDIVSAYERALGLVSGGLVAFAIKARKLAQPALPVTLVLDTHRVSPDRFQVALDATVDGEPVGADWLDVASFALTHEDEAILPTSVWRSLVTRVVRDLGQSVGPAYSLRSEAALLLARHRHAQPVLLHAIGRFVTIPDSVFVADQIALLLDIDGPQAGDLVLRLLEQPPGQTRYGAAWVAAGKLYRRQFDDRQLERLERVVVRLVRTYGLDDGGLFNRLTDLVAALPVVMQERISRAITHDPLLAAARESATHTWSRETMRDTCAAIARPGGERDDPMLDRLVEEALFHRLAERRLHSSLALAQSPYADRVAAGAAGLVRRADADPHLVEKAMVLLTFVATEQQRDLLCDVADDPTSPNRVSALVSVAHLPPAPGRARIPSLRAALAGDPPVGQPVARAAIYVAGMTSDPALQQVAEDPAVPKWVRRTAVWWLRAGPAIHDQPPAHRPTA